MDYANFITQEEKKTRDQWLFWSVQFPLASWAVLAASLFLFSRDVFLLALPFFVPIILFYYIAYRCAYKKPGTIFLSLNLAFISFMSLYNFYDIFLNISHFQNNTSMWLALSYNIILMLYYGFFFYSSFILRKINAKIKLALESSELTRAV